MIDHERRAIFIHVPKTAGMSIYEAFGIRNQLGHLRLEDHPEHPSDYFSFAFVRNPWDRAVSTWFYLRQGGRGNDVDLEARAVVRDCPSFEHFARHIAEYRQRLLEVRAPGWGVPLPGHDLEDRRYPHLLPQTTWTHDAVGRQVVDFVGRFERLEADVAHIAQVLGTTLTLGRHNTSERADFRSYYGRRSRAAIAREYEADLEAFDYRW